MTPGEATAGLVTPKEGDRRRCGLTSIRRANNLRNTEIPRSLQGSNSARKFHSNAVSDISAPLSALWRTSAKKWVVAPKRTKVKVLCHPLSSTFPKKNIRRSQQLQRSDSLSSPNWSSVGGVFSFSSNYPGPTVLVDQGGATLPTPQYYRVIVLH